MRYYRIMNNRNRKNTFDEKSDHAPLSIKQKVQKNVVSVLDHVQL